MGKSGAAIGDLLRLVFQNFDVLAGPLVSLAYPLYASIRAIETRNAVGDDRQWLTYWVLYSMITLFELTFDKVIEWFPFWSYVKLLVTCWLVIPQFSGAAYVYEHYVRPFYTGDQTVNMWHVPHRKHVLIPHDETPIVTESTPIVTESTPIVTESTPIVTANKYVYGYNSYDTYQDVIQPSYDQEIRYSGGGFFPEYQSYDDYVY